MKIPIRVYYEDTDCGGVVYYANYLRFFERGRTEFFRETGVSIPELQERGFFFLVRKAEIEYLSPCRYDDLLTVETRVSAVTGATVAFSQSIIKQGGNEVMARGLVVLVSVGKTNRPIRLPKEVRDAVEPHNEAAR